MDRMTTFAKWYDTLGPERTVAAREDLRTLHEYEDDEVLDVTTLIAITTTAELESLI